MTTTTMFHWTTRAELGAAQMRLRMERCETRDWRTLRRVIEERIGLRRGTLPNGKRVDSTTSDAILVRGRVIANIHHRSDTNLGPLDRQERLSTLPYLEERAALEDGDVIVIERLPPGRYVNEKLSVKGYEKAVCGRVPQHLERLLRLDTMFVRDTSADQDTTSDDNGNEHETGKQTLILDGKMSESERIDAIINHATAERLESDGNKRRRHHNADDDHNNDEKRYARTPPHDYVCRRCGIAGHWLRYCPTHGNRDFDRARALTTNGIPKALLRPIDQAPSNPDAIYYVDQTGNLYAMRDLDDPERIRFDAARATVVDRALLFPAQR